MLRLNKILSWIMYFSIGIPLIVIVFVFIRNLPKIKEHATISEQLNKERKKVARILSRTTGKPINYSSIGEAELDNFYNTRDDLRAARQNMKNYLDISGVV